VDTAESPDAAARIPEAVVDASVAAKWLLRDEEDVDRADGLLHRFDAGDLLLFAPRQIEVEVAAAVRKAVLNQRLSAEAAEEVLARWLGPFCGRLRLAENADLLAEALPRALALGITLFDALYVTLAEALDTELIVADSRLVRSSALQLPVIRALSACSATR
jgi:predicted nucleic acid-binding protein